MIGLGDGHSCMITAAGSGGTVPCTSSPLRVAGNINFATIDGSVRHTCGLATDGAASCWGFGIGGQLGEGRGANSPVPAAVAGGLRFVALDVGIGGLVTCGNRLVRIRMPGGVGGVGQLRVYPSRVTIKDSFVNHKPLYFLIT